MAASLRERQVEALRAMLQLQAGGQEPSWKVLVYDKTGQDILGPLLSVKELRDLGVTLYLQLHSDRDSIPDAPAVYFCLPTPENVQRLCQDLGNQLYGGYHYNFISPVSRPQLEDIATAALQAGCEHLVQRLFDQYTNFICLEDDMFCLAHQGSPPPDVSYYSLSRGEVTDTEMETMLSSITDSLFALCVTLGTVPIIRCPAGNAAEAVAERLERKLRDNLRDARNSLFSDGTATGRYSFHRPVLVLVDRSVDMATPLHHTWTYQALAHDVLKYQQNRVTVPAGAKEKVFELEQGDEFWTTHKGSPFPQVAEAIQEALEEIKGREEEIRQVKKDLGLGDDTDAALANLNLSDGTAKLTSAVSSLPQLLERKRLIDQHCSLATSVLDAIKQRRLDVFFELEEKLMAGQSLDRSLMEVLEDPENGVAEDKLRLFLIFFLSSPAVSEAELEQYSAALQAAGCDLAPLTYLRRWRSFTQQSSKTLEVASGQQGGTRAVNMFSSLISQSSNFVMAGVKNLVVKRHNLPVTRVVDEIMEQRQGGVGDSYRYLDPKILRNNDSSQTPRTKTPFSDALVFVVGGGNYIEHQNLQEYVKSRNVSLGVGVPPRRVVYGCTQLTNAHQFLAQLARLGVQK